MFPKALRNDGMGLQSLRRAQALSCHPAHLAQGEEVGSWWGEQAELFPPGSRVGQLSGAGGTSVLTATHLSTSLQEEFYIFCRCRC